MHILLDNAKRYTKKNDDRGFLFRNFSYDTVTGYWKSKNGKALITSKCGFKPKTKKADLETGEDQKGE